jgi:hypothetical protein
MIDAAYRARAARRRSTHRAASGLRPRRLDRALDCRSITGGLWCVHCCVRCRDERSRRDVSNPRSHGAYRSIPQFQQDCEAMEQSGCLRAMCRGALMRWVPTVRCGAVRRVPQGAKAHCRGAEAKQSAVRGPTCEHPRPINPPYPFFLIWTCQTSLIRTPLVI